MNAFENKRLNALLVQLAAVMIGLAVPRIGQPATFTVNSPADGADVNPGDRVCDTAMVTSEGEPECTLRAGVEESNALSGGDVVRLPAGTYTIAGSHLTILDNLAIEGEGADGTVIRRSQGGIFQAFTGGIFQVGTRQTPRVQCGGMIDTPDIPGIAATVMISKVKMMGGGGIERHFASGATGGAILNNEGSTLLLENVTITVNTAQQGGGIANMGSLTLRRSSVSANLANGRGRNASGGGGILNGQHDSCDNIRSANALIENSTVGGTLADPVGSQGCAVIGAFASPPLDESCGNQGDKQGGGITNYGTLEIRNSTLSGNTFRADPKLSNSVGGAGITNGGQIGVGGDVTLNNVTITNNLSRNGVADGILTIGDIAPDPSDPAAIVTRVSLANTLVAGGGSAWDCKGTLTSLGYNWIGRSRDCTIRGDDADLATTVIFSFPFRSSDLVQPLKNNDGPTETHELLVFFVVETDETAVDGGNPRRPGSGGPACARTDQRGFLRPAPGFRRLERCDVGAVETNASPPVCRGLPATIIGTPGDDGIVNLGSFYGTDGPDVIHGLGGVDFIDGLGGDDTVCGGGGIGILLGGAGNDDLAGGSETDLMAGERGDDRLFGGEGRDILAGGAGDDLMKGGPEDDLCVDFGGTNTFVSCDSIRQ